MLARNDVLTLLAMENDRSPLALVAEFTNRSLQITITYGYALTIKLLPLIGNRLAF